MNRFGRTHAQQMADREHQISTVHRIEMEVADALLAQIFNLLRGNCGRDQLVGDGVVIQPVETRRSIVGNARAAPLGEARDRRERMDWRYPRHDGNGDARVRHPVDVAVKVPASTLRLSTSISVCQSGLSGWRSG